MKYWAIYITIAISLITCIKDILIDTYTFIKINDEHEKRHAKIGFIGNGVTIALLLLFLYIATSIQSSEDSDKNTDVVKHQKELKEQKGNFERIINRLKIDSANLNADNIALSQKLDRKTDYLYKQLRKGGDEYVRSLNKASENLVSNITGGDAIVYLEFYKNDDTHFVLCTKNESKFTVPNVFIKIDNYSKIKNCVGASISDTNKVINCEINNMIYAGYHVIHTNNVGRIDPTIQAIDMSGNIGLITVYFHLPNYEYSQQIVYKYFPQLKKMLYDYRLIRREKGKNVVFKSTYVKNGHASLQDFNMQFEKDFNIPFRDK